MSCSSKETNFFEAIFIIVRNYAPPHFIYLLFLFFLYFFMHQLAPNALSHFYVPPHFICLLLLFFLLFFMYQLTQIPFQNFFSILCTNRSPSPFDFHFSETSADPHHDTTTPHQATSAPHRIHRNVPAPDPTDAPLHHTSMHPIHHTALLATRLSAMQPHDPDPRRPDRRRTAAAPAATGARVAAGPPPTPATALARRRPDTVTPLAVPACRARLPCPLVAVEPSGPSSL